MAPAADLSETPGHNYSFGEKMHKRTRARAEQLATFVTTHGLVPARDAEDGEERALAEWACKYRRSGSPDPTVLQIIDDGGGYDNDARARVIELRRDELVAFVQAHGRLPRNRPGEEKERKLFSWARRHVERPDADPVVVELVDRMGGFRRNQTLRTHERVAELEQFFAEHGRLPHTQAEDEQETSLAAWLVAHRKRRGAHKQVLEIIRRYDAKAYGARAEADRRLKQLRAFVMSTGRRPKLTRTRPEESSLARWVAAALTRPELAEPVRQILEPYGLKSDQPRLRSLSPDSAWRIEQLRNFVAAHGHAPRRDGDEEEVSLYRWLHRSARARNPEPEVLEILPEMGHPSAHDRRVSQLEDFVSAHDRLPRSTGVEHELYTWMNQHVQRLGADPKVLALVATYEGEAAVK